MAENGIKEEITTSIPDDRFMLLLGKGAEGCPVRYDAEEIASGYFVCKIQPLESTLVDSVGFKACNPLKCPCMHWAKIITTEVLENMMVKILQQLTKAK